MVPVPLSIVTGAGTGASLLVPPTPKPTPQVGSPEEFAGTPLAAYPLIDIFPLPEVALNTPFTQIPGV